MTHLREFYILLWKQKRTSNNWTQNECEYFAIYYMFLMYDIIWVSSSTNPSKFSELFLHPNFPNKVCMLFYILFQCTRHFNLNNTLMRHEKYELRCLESKKLDAWPYIAQSSLQIYIYSYGSKNLRKRSELWIELNQDCNIQHKLCLCYFERTRNFLFVYYRSCLLISYKAIN